MGFSRFEANARVIQGHQANKMTKKQLELMQAEQQKLSADDARQRLVESGALVPEPDPLRQLLTETRRLNETMGDVATHLARIADALSAGK